MDIEDLSKTQLILLALLVSFVTSIATGIVTVSLMDKAPSGVTQTVNKVVQRTVERVSPADQNAGAGNTTVKEVTTVVKEDDLITQTITNNRQHLVRVYRGSGTTTEALGSFVGLGLLVDGGKLVATDGGIVAGGEQYSGILSDSRVVPLAVATTAATSSRIALLSAKDDARVSGQSATLAETSSLQLGQTVIALSGQSRDRVATGIIAELPSASEGGPITTVETNINAGGVTVGSPLVNMFDEVVGIALPSAATDAYAAFIPSRAIVDAVNGSGASQASDENEAGGDEEAQQAGE